MRFDKIDNANRNITLKESSNTSCAVFLVVALSMIGFAVASVSSSAFIFASF